MNAVAAIGSAVLVSSGAWLLYASRDLIKLGLASYKWRKTDGTIIDSRDDSFTIEGIDRNQGNTYCFGGWAEMAGAAYLIGTQVPVYYDPKQPDRAVLKPGLKFGAIFGLMPICAGLIWLFFTIRD